jgi:hypothetical protein
MVHVPAVRYRRQLVPGPGLGRGATEVPLPEADAWAKASAGQQ